MRGSHLIKHWAVTQSTVCLSSGEAELGGICRGAAQAMGLRSLANDLGIKLDLEIHSDATSAIGICRRRGLGKIRHLAVSDLWVQDAVARKEFVLKKVLGKVNPADMLTKHVERPTIDIHMKTFGLYFESGRADSAASIKH